ncbi:MAG TPA: hypothetical protein DCY54_03750 [Parachlamydiales bacterium]|nr:MAG: hypothetical protein A2Z85_03035 [Chlamydiae bacterium GWA2_50_15]OGN57287.1 MAG: hypothetical protein A3D18_01225 [Chlamydiae bacterium RIFCSPHIGHO2_02_FULL_49_29]OGN62776.1 MAG: hypothetical protein A3E26_05835 [Chlamydiae bacterium RIFCSPHIGHO2_12_FULL_49_32]OGN70293.1 MAG: hypothetical protein A3I15_02705 [Chlamydiae bacterium RIFCSPLOWO2_02_FULL_49_12]OGN71501.1 MAG: hypothetical protein A3G30_04560 [Chlamydiae bacterium RIFCSPLOWO2_12_FULL_49_12]HAZ15729.1 hypothetical protein [P
MNRRDLIIISALINAGLLIILFATALKTDSDVPAAALPQEPMALAAPEVKPLPEQESPKVAAGDEVDRVLKEFAARTLAQQGASSPNAPAQTPPADSSSVVSPFTPIAVTQAPSENLDGLPSPHEEFSSSYSPPVSPPGPLASRASLDGKKIRVKKGDYLDKIARLHGCSVGDIMRLNHLTTTQLKIGQLLMLPEKKKSVSAQHPQSVPAKAHYYVVKQGDNPAKIAKKHHLNLNELLRLNNLNEESARQLKPGDQLRIR